jgi:glycosyltransferase involved in cell wall biosynthesis
MDSAAPSGQETSATAQTMAVSVIVPAWNESAELPATLDNLRSTLLSCGEPWELIVVDNASSDDTAAVAIAHGARVVHEPHRQIARARNTGAKAAGGRYFLFVDADTRPPERLVLRAIELLRSGRCCGGGAHLRFESGDNRLLRLGASAWNRLASRLGLGAGCFVFATRDAFAAVGGFSEAVYAGEEIGFSRRLRRYGKACGQPLCIIDQPPVLTSSRKAQWHSAPRQLGWLLLITVYPLALRSRRLCGFWYTRPPVSRAAATVSPGTRDDG